uniref:pyrroline-5-carboxylate reductase n=1 Tax=Meloidogyne javanica TaxID=6303 RepID=A0A915LKB8_MELJA
KLGINTTHDNSQVARENDVVILAVKPTIVSKVASEIAPAIRRDHLLISIALGITIRYIEQLLPSKSRIVRVMPNTPVVVGAGASAFSMGDSQIVQDLLSTVGYAVELPEIHIDPVTGLSGSGPSYGFAIIEGLSDGGVKLGLPRDLSMKLAAMTLYGAAKMFLETGEHPAILKEAIQSPGGSTIFGMHELEKGGLRGLLINAVEAGAERSRHMGQTSLPHSRTSYLQKMCSYRHNFFLRIADKYKKIVVILYILILVKMRPLRRSSRTKIFAVKFSPHTTPSKIKRSTSLNTFTIPFKQKERSLAIKKELERAEVVKDKRNEENETSQTKSQSQSFKQKESNHGRISVAIKNIAPASTSIIQLSESFRVAGLNWRLQILFNRNTFTGQSRFISVYVICEDLPFNETLIALITFRLVSQEEGYAGMDNEIIAHFNGSNRSVGISNFILFKNIFAEDSEYVNKDFNEAQIVAIIRVKSRQKTIMSDKIFKGEESETKENLLQNKVKDNTLESIENKNPDENSAALNESVNNSEQRTTTSAKNKITDFFPSRRSSRITPSFLDILRLQVLKEQVNLAVNEPYLDIFTSATKGRGLRTQLAFSKDEFVVEYKGVHNEKKLCIDATKETGDKGRLVNHSRLVPNLKAKIIDFGEKYPHLCLVAIREIQIGEELLFDYGDRTALTVEKHPWLLNT